MIKLTRFTGEEFYINPEVIRFVEGAGDTVITLTSGERLLVKEGPDEVAEAFIQYKQAVTHRTELPLKVSH